MKRMSPIHEERSVTLRDVSLGRREREANFGGCSATLAELDHELRGREDRKVAA